MKLNHVEIHIVYIWTMKTQCLSCCVLTAPITQWLGLDTIRLNANIRQHTPEVMQPVSNDILLRTTRHVFLPLSVFLTSSATHGP